jgi:phospho-N-acetylmuramoyl-pentapeptide-transferase
MLYHLSEWLKEIWFPFNVFHYISFRSFLAFLIAFFVVVVVLPRFGRFVLKFYPDEGVTREYLEHHKDKSLVPTAGGIVIVITLIVLSFLFLRLDTPYPYLASLVLLLFGLIGFADDFSKIAYKNGNKFRSAVLNRLVKNRGLTAKQKFLLQILAATLVGILASSLLPVDTKLYFPLFKELNVDLGPFYLLWFVFIVVGFSNALNLTDGLDGLAIGVSLTTAAVMAFVAYLAGNVIYANYLGIPYVPYTGELTILLLAFIGSGLAFLWHNTFPAKIFMGDSGSLAIGALLSFIALATKSEFIFFVAGGIMVVEVISVILQVSYCKLTRKLSGECKRIFKMSPIHHHFEKLGWAEPQIVVRFWIISILLGIASLTLLKLR